MFQFGGADACCVSVWQAVLECVHRGFEIALVPLVAGGIDAGGVGDGPEIAIAVLETADEFRR